MRNSEHLCLWTDHISVPTSGGINVSGERTLSQATLPVLLQQQTSNQSLEYVSDVQVQPTTDEQFVSGKLLRESLSAYSTGKASMIMRTRDMLLELYKARTKQR